MTWKTMIIRRTCSAVLLLCSSGCVQSEGPDSAPATPNAGDADQDTGTSPVTQYNDTDNKATLNPPSLLWPPNVKAESYTVEWSTSPTFATVTTITEIGINTYTHYAPWSSGTYYWRYRSNFTASASDWVSGGQIVVSADAPVSPLPTLSQLRDRVPKSHPRLMMRPEQLSALRTAATTTLAADFAKVIAGADSLVNKAPPPEPTSATKGGGWAVFKICQSAMNDAQVLAFAYLITGKATYGQAARKWIMALASWSPSGATGRAANDYAAAEMTRLGVAYDWAFDTLTDTDRATVRAILHQRQEGLWWKKGTPTGVIPMDAESHSELHYLYYAAAAVALFGDIPEADLTVHYSINRFRSTHPAWADNNGGWHEGYHYWAVIMGGLIESGWMSIVQQVTQTNPFLKPYYRNAIDYPLYVVPPGAPNGGFGDMSNSSALATEGRGSMFLDQFQRTANGPGGRGAYWRWWMQARGIDPTVNTSDKSVESLAYVQRVLHGFTSGPLPDATPPTDLPQSKVFAGTGTASLHVSLLDAADDVHLLFRSNPMGTKSHGNTPQNTFQLDAYGDSLLADMNYRDQWFSLFHQYWVLTTRAHNTLLVNGDGQYVPPLRPGTAEQVLAVKYGAPPVRNDLATGKIIASSLSPKIDYVAGDASAAYQTYLQRFHRHVLFLKPGVVVIYDDIVAKAPATYQWMLHSYSPFTIDAQAQRLTVDRQRAGVDLRYLGTTPLNLVQWDGYSGNGNPLTPPASAGVPNQWHVKAELLDPSAAIEMLTVMVPYRAGAKPAWTAERLESATAIGVRFAQDGKKTILAFRRQGVQGLATLAAKSFNDSFGVWEDRPAGR